MEERKSTGGSAEDKHVSQTENSGEKFPSVGTEENLSLGGVTPGHSFELKEIYPADEESETRDHSLVEICPMFSQAAEECGSSLRKGPPPLESVESAESATSAVRHILREIVGKAVVDKAPKKRKKPVMKSGWMTLREVIPDFDIDDSMFKEMLFRETLLVSTFEENSSYPTPVGALSLDIQSAKGGPLTNVKKTRSDYVYPKFLVHLSSQFNFYGHNGGSRIMAWVDRDLQTLEEIRKEFVQLENNEFDWQSLYVNAQDTFYYMRHNKKDDKFSSPERAKNLICEGANFILMRYLAMKRFIGTFEVSTVYINGDLCRNVYTCRGPQSGTIYNKKLDVCKIYRTIIEECGIEHRSITLMTLGGRILKQEWHDCDYILQVNPLMEVGNKPSPRERVPLEKDFENDLQLLSLYLDAKTVNKKQTESYMHDHPEIRHYISDYLQTILQLKPENVFEFSARYFLGFTPKTEYFEPTPLADDDDEVDFWRYF